MGRARGLPGVKGQRQQAVQDGNTMVNMDQHFFWKTNIVPTDTFYIIATATGENLTRFSERFLVLAVPKKITELPVLTSGELLQVCVLGA